MTPTCSAYGCLNTFEKGCGLGFFRFPALKSRRLLWMLALRRKHFTPSDHTRICGAHFVTGRPSKDPTHIDYVPSLFKFKYPKHESRKFRKVLCEGGEPPILDAIANIQESDEQNVDLYLSDHEFESEIKIESEINSPSELSIVDVQNILENDEVYNPYTQTAGSHDKDKPMSYTFLNIEGNVIARFVKKHVKKKPVLRSKSRPKQNINPDSVRLVFENNVARIVADEAS